MEAAVELPVRGSGAGSAAGAGAAAVERAAAVCSQRQAEETNSSCCSRCYCCTACRSSSAHEQVLAECAATFQARRRQLKQRADGQIVKRALYDKLYAPLIGIWAARAAQAAVGPKE